MAKSINNTGMRGVDKVALILLSVNEDNAAKVFSMFNEEEIKLISQAIGNLSSLKQDTLHALLEQLASEVTDEMSFLNNIQATERLLSKVLDKEQLAAIMDDMKSPKGTNTWEKLGHVNEEVLTSYLKNEHPQTVALVVSKLTPDQGAKVFSAMSEDFTFEVMMRMLNMGSVKKEVLDRVEKILRNEFLSTVTRTQKYNSHEMLAEIFNSFDRSSESKFMTKLEKQAPDAAEKIKNLMFTFEDLLKLDATNMQTLMRFIDKDKLTIALKGSSEKLKEMFIANMTKRAAKILEEDLEAMGPTRVRDVDEAQNAIVLTAKDLINKGEITMMDNDKDEFI